MAYWDTSCLLKLYASEADSADFKTYILNGASLVTSEIARLELHAALQRKEAVQDLHRGGARRALAEYDTDVAMGLIAVMPMDAAVVTMFETVIEQCCHATPPLLLRTLDAIHLSTAMVSRESVVVVTDHRLCEAALNRGLAVYPPP